MIKVYGSNRVGSFFRGLLLLYIKVIIEVVEDLGMGGSEEGCGLLNNYLVCVVEREVLVENVDCGIESGFEVKIGVVVVEILIGDVVYGEFNDNFMRVGFEVIILSLFLVEMLFGECLFKRIEKVID